METMRIKQLLCRHDYEVVSDKVMVKDGHYILMRTKYRCAKCGKVIYT